MVAIVLATGVSNLLTQDTIYTLKLRRRGIDLSSPASATARAMGRPVAEIMGPVPEPLPDTMPLIEAAARLDELPDALLPVIDDHGAYRGVITGRMASEVLTSEHGDERTVSDATDNPPSVRSTQSLDAAIDLLDHVGTPVVPVLDESGQQLVGWLTATLLLRAVRAAATGAVAST
jgi:CIC family chloride channel protein